MEAVTFDCRHSSCFGKSVSPQEHLMYFGATDEDPQDEEFGNPLPMTVLFGRRRRRSKRKSRVRSRRKKPMPTARRSKRKRRKRKCYSRVKGHVRHYRGRRRRVRSHCRRRKRSAKSRRRRSRSKRSRFGSQVAIPRDPEAMPGTNNGTWGWNMVNSFYPPGLGGPLGNRVQSLPINYSLS